MTILANLKQKITHKNLVILFVVLGFLLYANSLNNQMFWDDDDIVLNNRFVHNFELSKFFTENQIAGAGLNSNYWRPLMLTVFSLQWQIWQDWTTGYHLVKLLFHITNTVLLYSITVKLFRLPLLSFLTSLVFLIHPLQTEAVTYVSGLADVLSTLFTFLGIIFYFRFRDTPKFDDPPSLKLPPSLFELRRTSRRTGRTNWKYYALTIACYLAAFLSKDTAVIMPAMLVITDFFFLPQNFSIKQRLIKVAKSIWPFFVIATLYFLLRATALNFREIPFIAPEFTTRVLIFFRVLVVYFGLLFWPNNLHMERSVEIPQGFEIDVLLGGLMTITLIVVAIFSIKRYPVVSFGIVWFFARLFPNSNLVFPNAGLIYEHWMYVPMAGIFLIIFFAILNLFQDLKQRFRNKFGIAAVIASLLIYFFILGSKTIARNNDWDNPIRFYNQTLQYAPNSYRIVNNLGMAYADDKQHDRAIEMYQRAIMLDANNAVAYHNLGNTYKDLGKKELAVKSFETAIEKQPDFIFSYHVLLNLYLKDKDYSSAIKILERLQQQHPGDQSIMQLIEQIRLKDALR